MTGHRLRVGDRVRCERAGPTRGTWARYAGREGTVVSVNVSKSVSPEWPDVVEVGVKFGAGSNRNADAWFRAAELVVLDGRTGPSQSPLGDATVGSGTSGTRDGGASL